MSWTGRPGGLPLPGDAVALFLEEARPSIRELELWPVEPTLALVSSLATSPVIERLARISMFLVSGGDTCRDVVAAFAGRRTPELVTIEIAGDVDEPLLRRLADATLRPKLARLNLWPSQPLAPSAIARLRLAQPLLDVKIDPVWIGVGGRGLGRS